MIWVCFTIGVDFNRQVAEECQGKQDVCAGYSVDKCAPPSLNIHSISSKRLRVCRAYWSTNLVLVIFHFVSTSNLSLCSASLNLIQLSKAKSMLGGLTGRLSEVPIGCLHTTLFFGAMKSVERMLVKWWRLRAKVCWKGKKRNQEVEIWGKKTCEM